MHHNFHHMIDATTLKKLSRCPKLTQPSRPVEQSIGCLRCRLYRLCVFSAFFFPGLPDSRSSVTTSSLWERDVRASRAGSVDWPEVMMMNGRTADQLNRVCSAAESCCQGGWQLAACRGVAGRLLDGRNVRLRESVAICCYLAMCNVQCATIQGGRTERCGAVVAYSLSGQYRKED